MAFGCWLHFKQITFNSLAFNKCGLQVGLHEACTTDCKRYKVNLQLNLIEHKGNLIHLRTIDFVETAGATRQLSEVQSVNTARVSVTRAFR
jgi:hypothetical protein